MSGDEAAWSDIIHDRVKTEPPRPYWPALLQRMASFPSRYHALIAVAGAGLFANAVKSDSVFDYLLGGTAGLIMSVFGGFGYWLARSRRT